MQWLNHRALETEVTVLFSRASETHRPLYTSALFSRASETEIPALFSQASETEIPEYFAELRFTDYRDFFYISFGIIYILSVTLFSFGKLDVVGMPLRSTVRRSRRPLHSHKSRQRNNAITPQRRKNHALQIDIYFCRNDKFAGENILQF